jgi:hypothetical protein
MGEIYVTSGDNSGMFFSGFGEEDGFEDADTAWENYDEEKRLETLIDYISYEYED